MINSLLAAVSMYTRIPVPGFKWDEKSLGMMLGFLPAAGAIEGGIFLIIYIICLRLGCADILKGAMLFAVTVYVTGGIHLDGFSDVHDALSSYADAERKRAIMKDPHAGAFAVIHLCLYMILMAAACNSLHTIRQAAAMAFSFVLSRSLSGLFAFTHEKYLLEGSLSMAVHGAFRYGSMLALVIFAAAAACGICACSPLYFMASAVLAIILLIRHRKICMESFGGFNGDTAGWLIMRLELAFIYVIVLVQYLMEVAAV